MREGDRVKTVAGFQDGRISFSGRLVSLTRPHRTDTVDHTNKPCKRTHTVFLDTAFQEHRYLTFCPEDLELE